MKSRCLSKPRVDAMMQAAQRSDRDQRRHSGKATQLKHVFPVWNQESHRARWGAIGLKFKFYTDGEERCIALFRPRPENQGYPGYLHGGIISALLDVPSQISMHADPLSV